MAKKMGPEKAAVSLVAGLASIALFFGAAPADVELWQQVGAVAVGLLGPLGVYMKSNSER